MLSIDSGAFHAASTDKETQQGPTGGSSPKLGVNSGVVFYCINILDIIE